MTKSTAQEAFWGAAEGSVAEWMERASKLSLVKRLWEKDPTLWKTEKAAGEEIRSRLGWLDAVRTAKTHLADLKAFAEEVKTAQIRHAVLLGMGGSSLAPWVFQEVCGSEAGFPELLVLDSTDPVKVKDVEAKLDLEKTLFIVSSKSGGTIELVSLFKYFYTKVETVKKEKTGEHFVAITDPDTSLEALAKEKGFRRVFSAPPDVGGRFSALTFFGLVPAALIGVDLEKVVGSAEKMVARTSPGVPDADNAALALGVGMAVLAEEGRDKLTIVAPEKFQAFGDWAEQLIAESTGKEGVGIVPVVGEPLADPASYGNDRFFVALCPSRGEKEEFISRLAKLKEAGHPVLSFKVNGAGDLGGEFLRWEIATAIACALMKINAFDQPDVQAAKDKTKNLLKELEGGKELSIHTSERTLAEFWENAEAGDYAAVLAFLPDLPNIHERLSKLRAQVRDVTKLAVTVGFGPRYLHSTGQLHKGGPRNGIFLIITAPHAEDLTIPGERYTFGQLETAQAMGDFEALEARGRWMIHCRLNDCSPEALEALCAEIESAAASQGKGA